MTWPAIVDPRAAEIRRLREIVDCLRAALRPLANVAVAIDENASCIEHKRPDNAQLWAPNVYQRGPFDLTMGHARAARRALEGKR